MQWRGARGGFVSPEKQGLGPEAFMDLPMTGVFNSDSIFINRLNNRANSRINKTKNDGGSMEAWGSEYTNGSGGGYVPNGAGGGGLNETGVSNPAPVGAATNWTNITGTRFFGAGVRKDGTAWTWGRNVSGCLGKTTGVGSLYTATVSGVAQIGALTNWAMLAAGKASCIAVKTDGTLWSWGDATSGQLGLGNTTSYSSPKQVGALTTWSKVFMGEETAFAIKSDGTLWAWGNGSNGRLGLGNTTSYSSPKQVGALTDWKTMTVGGSVVMAIKQNGILWAWGKSVATSLGAGSTSYRSSFIGFAKDFSSPVQISTERWKQIAVSPVAGSDGATLGIKTDGTLWAWSSGGANGSAFNGLGNNITYYGPKQIGLDRNWSSVATSRIFNPGNFVVATKSNGTLWAWGRGDNGVLGLNNTTSYSSPKQVGAGTSWQTAYALGRRAHAIRG